LRLLNLNEGMSCRSLAVSRSQTRAIIHLPPQLKAHPCLAITHLPPQLKAHPCLSSSYHPSWRLVVFVLYVTNWPWFNRIKIVNMEHTIYIMTYCTQT